MAARRPRTTSGRPPGADSARRRAEILDAAEELFAEQGYRGVSMSAVARASGISQTGLVHHFATKDDLLTAVLDRRDERDIAALDTGERAQGWAGVEALVDLVARNEERETMVRLYTAVAGEAVTEDHPATRWLRRHHDQARRRAVTSMEQAIAAGELREDTPCEQLARLLLAAMDGLQMQWLSDAAYPHMVEDFRLLVDTLHAQWRADRTSRTP